MSNEKKILLEKDDIQKIIKRISYEIIENNPQMEDVVLIGIRTRGEFIAHRVKKEIEKISKVSLDLGIIDVTFHRDDFRTNLGSPMIGPSDIQINLEAKKVVLLDDVLYTGRTIRSAMDEVFSFGRPSLIQLGVIVDRGHRELPIRPDYIGKNYPTSKTQHIHVYLEEIDDSEEVVLVDYMDQDR